MYIQSRNHPIPSTPIPIGPFVSPAGDTKTGREVPAIPGVPTVPYARPLLTTRQAAEYCGLAKNTLEKMRLYGRKDDNTPRFIKLGSAVRYHPDDLDAWIARNRAITTSEYDPSN